MLNNFGKFITVAGLSWGLLSCDYLPKASIVELSDQDKQQVVNSIVKANSSLLSKFEDHNMVALGDAHFYDDVMRYVTQLVTSDTFVKHCQHIVVEFGNRKYQSLIDKYVSGEAVPESELKKVWQDTLFFTAWTPEVYGDFFRAVREFNLSRQPKEQLKVTLAEREFDWQQIESSEQWQALAENKVAGFNNTILAETKPNEKILLVFGAFHTLELSQNLIEKIQHPQKPLVTLLSEQNYKVYSVWPVIQEGVIDMLADFPAAANPGLFDVKLTPFSTLLFADIFPKARVKLREMNAPDAQVGELFDGLLYLGDIKRTMVFPDALLKDKQFIEKSQRRVALIGGRVEQKFNQVLSESVK